MKKNNLTYFNVKGAMLSFIFAFSFTFCEGQTWDWGKAEYNYDTPLMNVIDCSSVATDKQGDAYVTGDYEDTVKFGSLILSYPSAGSPISYLVKYNSTGTVQWAVQPVYSAFSEGFADATDTAGNILVTGVGLGRVVFGTDTLGAGTGNYYVMLVKFDKNGNVLWARGAGERNSESSGCSSEGFGVAADKAGNVYITGEFSDTLFFGIDTLICGIHEDQVFIAKYDANGNFLWARQNQVLIHNISEVAKGLSVVYYGDPDTGWVYVAGYFNQSIAFGNDTLTGNNSIGGNTFIVRYDPNGNEKWARQSTTTIFGTGAAYAYSVTTDDAGSAYSTGYVADTVIFGSGILVGSSGSPAGSAFLTKYNSSGEELWSKITGTGEWWIGYSLACDAYNHIYMGGIGFNDTISWGSFTVSTPTHSANTAFLLEFDTAGNALCGSILKNGGAYSDNAPASVGVASDSTGQFTFLAGTFDNNNIYCGSDTLTQLSSDTLAGYIARWQSCAIVTNMSAPKSPASIITVFPNPNNGVFTIQSSVVSEQLSVEIFNVMGQNVLTDIRHPADYNRIDLTGQPNGIYFYRVLSQSGALIGEGKVVIEK